MDQPELPYQVKIENFERSAGSPVASHQEKTKSTSTIFRIALGRSKYLDHLSVMKELNSRWRGSFGDGRHVAATSSPACLQQTKSLSMREDGPDPREELVGDRLNINSSRRQLRSWIIRSASGGIRLAVSPVRRSKSQKDEPA